MNLVDGWVVMKSVLDVRSAEAWMTISKLFESVSLQEPTMVSQVKGDGEERPT